MNVHHLSVLNPNFAPPSVHDFLRLGELGTVLLCVFSFTFYIHSYGTFPQNYDLILQLSLASTVGLNPLQ